MIDLMTASVVSGAISSAALLIRMWMRLRYQDRRDKREAERYRFAALQVSDAYYRGGEKALRSMGDVQVDLLRASGPETQRRIVAQLRRALDSKVERRSSRLT